MRWRNNIWLSIKSLKNTFHIKVREPKVFNVNQCLAVKRRVYESDLTRALLSKKTLSALPVDEKAEPVFVVGCGHSGTSLLVAVLDSHPELRALPGENYNFWAWFDRDKVLSRFQPVFEGIANDGLRPLEKTPRYICSASNSTLLSKVKSDF